MPLPRRVRIGRPMRTAAIPRGKGQTLHRRALQSVPGASTHRRVFTSNMKMAALHDYAESEITEGAGKQTKGVSEPPHRRAPPAAGRGHKLMPSPHTQSRCFLATCGSIACEEGIEAPQADGLDAGSRGCDARRNVSEGDSPKADR